MSGANRDANIDAWVSRTMKLDVQQVRANRPVMGGARMAAPAAPAAAVPVVPPAVVPAASQPIRVDPAQAASGGYSNLVAAPPVDAAAGYGQWSPVRPAQAASSGYSNPVDASPPDGSPAGNQWTPARPTRSAASERSEQSAAASLPGEGVPSSPLGLEGKPLGANYLGEERGEGWQVGRLAGDKQIKTEYFDADEQARQTLSIGPSGSVSHSDGSTPADGLDGFVMDPATGDLHRFKKPTTDKSTHVSTTHHSSALAGGDVAGAGQIKYKDGRIEELNDQSGHYRPDATFTFQTVRQINIATLSSEIRAKLVKRPSASAQGGEAESPDTLEQLIAAEVGAARDRYFADLDMVEASAIAHARTLPNAEQDAKFEKIAADRRVAADDFRTLAAALQASLASDSLSPLLRSGSDEEEDEPEEDGSAEEYNNENMVEDGLDRLALAGGYANALQPDNPAGKYNNQNTVEDGLDRLALAGGYANALQPDDPAGDYNNQNMVEDGLDRLASVGGYANALQPDDPAGEYNNQNMVEDGLDRLASAGGYANALQPDDPAGEYNNQNTVEDGLDRLASAGGYANALQPDDPAGEYNNQNMVEDGLDRLASAGGYANALQPDDPAGEYNNQNTVEDGLDRLALAGGYANAPQPDDPAGEYNNRTVIGQHRHPAAPADVAPGGAPARPKLATKETVIELLGKTGGLDSVEYQALAARFDAIKNDPQATPGAIAAAENAFTAGYNKISMLKQLAAPLGEVAYADLLKTKKIDDAMLQAGLAPGQPGSVAALKALLGKQAASDIAGDDGKVAAAADKFGLAPLDTKVTGGVEHAALLAGLATSIRLTAQQFLQTGGNEAQIRNKARLNSEINAVGNGPVRPAAPDTPPLDPGISAGYFDFDKEKS